MEIDVQVTIITNNKHAQTIILYKIIHSVGSTNDSSQKLNDASMLFSAAGDNVFVQLCNWFKFQLYYSKVPQLTVILSASTQITIISSMMTISIRKALLIYMNFSGAFT